MPSRGNPENTANVILEPSTVDEQREYGASKKTKTFEFVTITTKHDTEVVKSTSKQVRTHAMRDYLRKKHHGTTAQIETSKPEVAKPNEYRNKFKLSTWSHKTADKAKEAKEAKERERERRNNQKILAVVSKGESTLRFQPSGPQSLQSFAVSGSVDPFDSLAIKLGPRTQQLFKYYSTAYSMNSVAINAEGNLFSYVKTDPGLFHSLMYLVALHYDLKQGVSDSAVTLHHGGKAFGIIYERLGDPSNGFSDMTIGAVAMLVNKENLNGRYSLSKMHMEALKFMVAKRGGVHNLASVFQRVVIWPDFCFANIWNCQPVFSRLHREPSSTPDVVPHRSSKLLRPSHLFGLASPIVPIFNTLRDLSADLDPDHIAKANRLKASISIYNLEYDILLLNKVSASDPEPTECIFSFEAIPLKTAIHIYLWIVLRELPASSELIYQMVLRLKDSLEVQTPGWWNGTSEREMWLLWILFVGAMAADERDERFWFVGEMMKICQSLGIWSLEELRESLMKVLWQEAFCETRFAEMWRDMRQLDQVELRIDDVGVS